jgi:hypothetical protein
MAHHPHTADRREAEPRDDRPAPSYPMSASKHSAARRRELTDAILRARAA